MAQVSDSFTCPSCGQLMTLHQCSSCGLRTDTPSYGALWHASEQLRQLQTRRDDMVRRVLAESRSTSRAEPSAASSQPTSWPAPKPLVHTAPKPSWWTVQNLLLSLGAFSIVIAVSVFLAVTWRHLNLAAKGAVLLAITALVLALATVLHRRRLDATAEALGVIGVAMMLVDIRAVQLSYNGTISDTSVLALGLALSAPLLAYVGSTTALRSLRWAATSFVFLLVPVALVANHSSAPLAAIALALQCLAAQYAITRIDAAGWTNWGRGLARAGVAVSLGSATLLALAALDSPRWPLTPGALIVVAAVAGVLTWWHRSVNVVVHTGSFTAAGLLTVAVLHGTSFQLSSDGVLTTAAFMAPFVLAIGFVAGRIYRRGIAAVGVLVAIVGASPVATHTAGGVLGPLLPLSMWTHRLSARVQEVSSFEFERFDAGRIWIHVVLVGFAVGTAWWLRPAVRNVVWVVGALGILATVPVVARLPVAGAAWGLLLVGLTTTFGLRRQRAPWMVGATAPLLVWALGWSAANRWLTITVLVALTVAAVAVAWLERTSRPTRCTVAYAISFVGAVTTTGFTAHALRASPPTVWLTVLGAAVLVSFIAFGTDSTSGIGPVGRPAELVGSVGAAVAMLGLIDLSDDHRASVDQMTIALLVLGLGLGVHALRPIRRWAAGGAALCLLVLIWLRLWDANIELVEAYSLPASALAFAIGWWSTRDRTPFSSWVTVGSGLLVALVPSVVMSVRDAEIARLVLIVVVAGGLVVAGAVRKLQAPLAVGGLSLVVVGVDQLWPVASQAPRWIVFGLVGAGLLFLGATFERRRRDVVDLAQRYGELR